MKNEYDVVIVGSGPAGLAAGIYAARAELKCVIVEKAPVSGGQIINTYEVENYPGIPEGSGFELAMKFREHCDKFKVEFLTMEVESLLLSGCEKVLTLENGEKITAKTVILATGTEYRKLGVKGETEFLGLGVSYCATCDGAFYRNKTTVVVGGGDVAVEDAIFLSRLCKQVYVVHRRDEFRAVKSLVKRLEACENVSVIWDSAVDEICGENVVKSVNIRNIKTGEVQKCETDGVFIAIGNVPNSEMVKGVVNLDKGGFIEADETCQTSVPGVFAAGDVRTKQLRQIITAASDGANAITSVEVYLNQLEKQ